LQEKISLTNVLNLKLSLKLILSKGAQQLYS
jgi:hypothetical protein